MKKAANQITKRIILISAISLLAFSAIFASNGKEVANTSSVSSRTSNAVVETLTKLLKGELVSENLVVRLRNVEQTRSLGNEVILQGEATCVLEADKTQLPLTFETKVDLTNHSVKNINYKFVEGGDAGFASNSAEEILMKELMQQISKDYKTSEIVISIDNFQTLDNLQDGVRYKGLAEVRIGALKWNKIDFDVTLNSASSSSVQYKIK